MGRENKEAVVDWELFFCFPGKRLSVFDTLMSGTTQKPEITLYSKKSIELNQNIMEKNIAILMADLSGYTALTETHGSVSAADLIDKYVRIAKHCLVGDTQLHQRTGDEIMFVSNSRIFCLQLRLS